MNNILRPDFTLAEWLSKSRLKKIPMNEISPLITVLQNNKPEGRILNVTYNDKISKNRFLFFLILDIFSEYLTPSFIKGFNETSRLRIKTGPRLIIISPSLTPGTFLAQLTAHLPQAAVVASLLTSQLSFSYLPPHPFSPSRVSWPSALTSHVIIDSSDLFAPKSSPLLRAWIASIAKIDKNTKIVVFESLLVKHKLVWGQDDAQREGVNGLLGLHTSQWKGRNLKAPWLFEVSNERAGEQPVKMFLLEDASRKELGIERTSGGVALLALGRGGEGNVYLVKSEKEVEFVATLDDKDIGVDKRKEFLK